MTAAYTSLSVLFGPQNVAWRRSRKNVVDTFLGAICAAACHAAVKRLSSLFIKKQYYQSELCGPCRFPCGEPRKGVLEWTASG